MGPQVRAKVVFDRLVVSTISVDVTLRMSTISDPDQPATASTIGRDVLVSLLGNLNHMPLRLAGWSERGLLSSREEFGHRAVRHYLQSSVLGGISLLLVG